MAVFIRSLWAWPVFAIYLCYLLILMVKLFDGWAEVIADSGALSKLKTDTARINVINSLSNIFRDQLIQENEKDHVRYRLYYLDMHKASLINGSGIVQHLWNSHSFPVQFAFCIAFMCMGINAEPPPFWLFYWSISVGAVLLYISRVVSKHADQVALEIDDALSEVDRQGELLLFKSSLHSQSGSYDYILSRINLIMYTNIGIMIAIGMCFCIFENPLFRLGCYIGTFLMFIKLPADFSKLPLHKPPMSF